MPKLDVDVIPPYIKNEENLKKIKKEKNNTAGMDWTSNHFGQKVT